MKPKVVLLIFVSGKIVLTGAKVREEIYCNNPPPLIRLWLDIYPPSLNFYQNIMVLEGMLILKEFKKEL
jgi:hypothetical protein